MKIKLRIVYIDECPWLHAISLPKENGIITTLQSTLLTNLGFTFNNSENANYRFYDRNILNCDTVSHDYIEAVILATVKRYRDLGIEVEID